MPTSGHAHRRKFGSVAAPAIWYKPAPGAAFRPIRGPATPMMLRDLLTSDARFDAALRRARREWHLGRQPRRQAGLPVRRRAGHQGRWARLCPPGDCGGCRRRDGRARAAGAVAGRCRLRERAQCAARAGARGREILSAPARHHRGRHRHQRQDLGRGVHAPNLGGARPCGGEHRHHRGGDAELAKSTAR